MRSRGQLDSELLRATEKNQEDEVIQLIEAGANVNCINDLASPLKNAARKGNASIVRILLNAGAKLRRGLMGNGYIHDPLYTAIDHNYFETVKVMLELNPKIDLNYAIYHSETPLKVAASRGNSSIVKLLLAYGAKPTCMYSVSGGISALSKAASQGNTEICDLLLDAGANVNSVEVCANRPLHAAAENGNLAGVQWLVEHGALIEETNNFSDTARNVAATKGHQHIVKYLTEQIARQNQAQSSPRFFRASDSEQGNQLAEKLPKLIRFIRERPEMVIDALDKIDPKLTETLLAKIEKEIELEKPKAPSSHSNQNSNMSSSLDLK